MSLELPPSYEEAINTVITKNDLIDETLKSMEEILINLKKNSKIKKSEKNQIEDKISVLEKQLYEQEQRVNSISEYYITLGIDYEVIEKFLKDVVIIRKSLNKFKYLLES